MSMGGLLIPPSISFSVSLNSHCPSLSPPCLEVFFFFSKIVLVVVVVVVCVVVVVVFCSEATVNCTVSMASFCVCLLLVSKKATNDFCVHFVPCYYDECIYQL